MKDLKERLEKLRVDAADFALMSKRTSDPDKRELFRRLADELAIEALELEQVVRRQTARPNYSVLQSEPLSIDQDNVVPLEGRSKQ